MENKNPTQDLESMAKNTSRLPNILSTVKREAKGYLTDTSAALIFYNPPFAASEYFVGGLEPEEILSTRIGMSIAALFISRPYGRFREYWTKRCKTNPDSSRLRKFVTDVSGNLIFYTPIYSTIMWANGVSPEEIALALPAGITTATIMGRPYGWFLDKWRKKFGVKPTLDHDVKEVNIPNP